MSTVTVHNLEQSRSFRVIWLLEELGRKYEVKQYKRDPKAHGGAPELLKLHPLGKSPLTTSEGRVGAETGAIFQYQLEVSDKDHKISFPAGTEDAHQLSYWLFYSEGTLMPAGLVAYRVRATGGDTSYFVDQLKANLKYVDGELGTHKWFVGDKFSAADIIIEFPVEFAASFPGINFEEYPRLKAWLKAIKERPGYKKALEANGHYDVKLLYK